MKILKFLKFFKKGQKPQKHITNSGQTPKISETRDINTPESREMKLSKRALSGAAPRVDVVAAELALPTANNVGAQFIAPETNGSGLMNQTPTDASGKASFAATALEGMVELVPIVDVREGDYVLSLNEETERIEPHRINGLLDMGIKPVFKLTTESGRYIKTTGNHPYLVKVEGGRSKVEGEWKKVIELQEGIQIAVPTADAWDGFYHSAQIKSQQPLQSRQQSTSTFLTSLFRIEPETYKHQYEKSNHASYSDSYWKTAEEIACKADRKDSLCQISKKFSDMFLTFSQNLIHWLKYNICSKLCQETYVDVAAENIVKLESWKAGKLGEWRKVVDLEIGNEIAVPEEINGRVFYGRDGLYKAPQGQISLLQRYQLAPLSFLFSFRFDKECYYKECKSKDWQGNSQPLSKINEKPASKGYSKYGFRNICKVARNKLSSISLNDFHWGKVYHSFKCLSSRFIEQSAYADISVPTHGINPLGFHQQDSLKAGFQQRVIASHEGAKQSHILWDKIVSIDYIGEEHVYDIEVEDTHNFIAGHVIARRPKADEAPPFVSKGRDEAISYFFGGIIAHNTYMSGSVGPAPFCTDSYAQVKMRSFSMMLIKDCLKTLLVKRNSYAERCGRTTGPVQKLHVEGQCVTGDTVLPIIRGFSTWPAASLEQYWPDMVGSTARTVLAQPADRGISKRSYLPTFRVTPVFSKTREVNTTQSREVELENRTLSGATPSVIARRPNISEADEAISEIASVTPSGFPRNDRVEGRIELVPIVDVREGDYVLSLNEETERIEPHRINGLLDMGIKPVFKLMTASGRFIKTTGNHPYLTKEGWRKVIELSAGQEIAVPKLDSMESTAALLDNSNASKELFFGNPAEKIFDNSGNFADTQKIGSQKDDSTIRSSRITQDISEVRMAGNKYKGFSFDKFVDFLIRGISFNITDIYDFMTGILEDFSNRTRAVCVNENLHGLHSRLDNQFLFVSQKSGIQHTSIDIFCSNWAEFVFNLLKIYPGSQRFKYNMDGDTRTFNTGFSMLDFRVYADMFVNHFFMEHFGSSFTILSKAYHILDNLSSRAYADTIPCMEVAAPFRVRYGADNEMAQAKACEPRCAT